MDSSLKTASNGYYTFHSMTSVEDVKNTHATPPKERAIESILACSDNWSNISK
jgi:hypothetical protein